MSSDDEIESCPSCGGAGGGPFGRAGGAWDTEDYVCPRCKGTGIWAQARAPEGDAIAPPARPGVVKAPAREEREEVATPKTARKRASGDPN